MKLSSIYLDQQPVVAARQPDGSLLNLTAAQPDLATDVGQLLAVPHWRERVATATDRARKIESRAAVEYRPVIPKPGKFLCLGLNDVDHAAESGLAVPEHPVVFGRFASSLVGHEQPLLCPAESREFDYEVELAVIIGRAGRRLSEDRALEHVAGYSVFNDGSVREYQLRTSQWCLGKNFPGTGALGPAMVSSDELPPGGNGLRMTTTIGGEVLQDGNTNRMIFPVARALALLSEAIAFEPGDVISMGTPSGVGFARKPPRFLKAGERCTVAIEGVGELSNPVHDDPVRGEGE